MTVDKLKEHMNLSEKDTGMLMRAFELGAVSQPVHEVDGTKFMVSPPGWSLYELTKMQDRPARVKQHVTLHDLDSFLGYLTEYADESSKVFVGIPQGCFEGGVNALLDYHASGRAGHCDHRVGLVIKPSADLLAWRKMHKVWTTQEQVAEFLLDVAHTIVEPTSADLLEMVQTLRVTKSVEFRSQKFLKNGQVGFDYDEAVSARAGSAGTLHLPELITIALKPFTFGDAYKIQVRLRYRLDDKRLQINLSLERLDDLSETAVRELVRQIEERSELPVFVGVSQTTDK